MQAIVVKFLGPTNTKPSRWSVSASAGRTIVSKGHYCDTNDDQDARMAAEAYMHRYGWDCGGQYELVEGGLPNGDRVFVLRLIEVSDTMGLEGRHAAEARRLLRKSGVS